MPAVDRPLIPLAGDDFHLIPAAGDDAARLLELLTEPSIREWWGEYDLARVHEELTGTYVVVIDGPVVGWLHCHEETDDAYAMVRFDILLATELQGRGLGRRVLRLAIEHFAQAGHHRFEIDPAVDNARAIASYTAAGFRPVGVLRRTERRPDGTWRDGLLMDLIYDELDAEPAGPARDRQTTVA